MIRLYNCLKNEHDWRLVLLAAVICLISSYAASIQLDRAKRRSGFEVLPWLLMLSFTVGFGIWATHFVAMLAYEPSVGFSYDLTQTIISLLVIVAINIPVFALITTLHKPAVNMAGAALLGLGISAMHYTGMYGLLPSGFLTWDKLYLTVSVVLGVILSVAAIKTKAHLDGGKGQLAFAILLTLAICATHFFGMSALTLLPFQEGQAGDAGISAMFMGALVGSTAIIILQIGIILAVLDSWIWRKRDDDKKRNQELETLLTSIADLAKIAAWSLDVKKMSLTWSPQLLQNHGLSTNQEMNLERAAAYFSVDDRPKFLKAVKQACHTGEGFDLELLYSGPDKSETWNRVVCAPLIEDGEITKLIGVYQDVTQHIFERDTLKQAVEEADRVNKLKSEFLASMSHELRTPLNGVLGMAQLLQMTALSEKQRKFTDTILVSGESLLTLIKDILDLSRIEAGLMEVHKVSFDPKTLVSEAVDTVMGIALKKGLSVSYKVEENVKGFFLGDNHRIRQVLINLLGNALKFTDKGGAKLLLKLEGNGSLGFYVIDSGPGIPKAKQAEIFERFTQADGSITRKHGGAGLGLSISQNLVSLMGGEIGVESIVGKGSVFWVKLPLETSVSNQPIKSIDGFAESPSGELLQVAF